MPTELPTELPTMDAVPSAHANTHARENARSQCARMMQRAGVQCCSSVLQISVWTSRYPRVGSLDSPAATTAAAAAVDWPQACSMALECGPIAPSWVSYGPPKLWLTTLSVEPRCSPPPPPTPSPRPLSSKATENAMHHSPPYRRQSACVLSPSLQLRTRQCQSSQSLAVRCCTVEAVG